MISEQLIQPRSIVVIGGSNDIRKPGGKVLKNLIDGHFQGKLYVTNLKEPEVQGITSYQDVRDLPQADLAIMAIAAKFIPDTAEILAREKGTHGFIVLSAGFSEESEEGRLLEERLVAIVESVGGSLIGPNCIGVMTPEYHGVFTQPIPRLELSGCDFISGSGATACFIMEAGIPRGLSFARVFSVGNSAQLGVEDILEYMDETYEEGISPKVKLLYIESIEKPDKLLRHASSLIRKGCSIAAIKAGASEAGSRAASSHTGALASSDAAVDALFRKAGIVRCYGREELISVASIFREKPLEGKNIAIITHAGGPAVMLTDELSNQGLLVPPIQGPDANELLTQLFPGSSVANPIDFLATGNAEQLALIMDYTENKFDHIDGMAVIFGTPGLDDIYDVYDVIDEKMKSFRKPVYPILPSTLTAQDEIRSFTDKGRVYFSDEVVFARALGKVFNTPPPAPENLVMPGINHAGIRMVIDDCSNGYLDPEQVQQLLDLAGIPRIKEMVAETLQDAIIMAETAGFPVVMKVIGPVHKSDVGGVRLNIRNPREVEENFLEIMQIEGATGVLIQPMISGIELFAGAKYEEKFGHLILCGLGGIFIEVLKDVSQGLAPLSQEESLEMIRSLKGYKIIRGVRGKQGADEQLFAEIVARLSALVMAAPEIHELDLNPLIGLGNSIQAVDARVRIEKQNL